MERIDKLMTEPRYGLRKLSIGLCSVLLGTTVILVSTAHADGENAVNNVENVGSGVKQDALQPYQTQVTTSGSSNALTVDNRQSFSPAQSLTRSTTPVSNLSENKSVDSGISDEQAKQYIENANYGDVVKTRVGWVLKSDIDKYKLANQSSIKLSSNWKKTTTVDDLYPGGHVDYSSSNLSLNATISASDLSVNNKILVGTVALGSEVDLKSQHLDFIYGGQTASFSIFDSKNHELGKAHFLVDVTNKRLTDIFLVTDSLTNVPRVGNVSVFSDFQNISFGLSWYETDYTKRYQMQGNAFYLFLPNSFFKTEISFDQTPIKYANHEFLWGTTFAIPEWKALGVKIWNYDTKQGLSLDSPFRLVQRLSGDFSAKQYLADSNKVNRLSLRFPFVDDRGNGLADVDGHPAINIWRADQNMPGFDFPVKKQVDGLSAEELYTRTPLNEIYYSVQHDGSILYSYNIDPSFFKSNKFPVIKDQVNNYLRNVNYLKLPKAVQGKVAKNNEYLLEEKGVNPVGFEMTINLFYDVNTSGSIKIEKVTPGQDYGQQTYSWQPPKKQHNSGSATAGESTTVMLIDDDAHGKTVSSSTTDFEPIGTSVTIKPTVPKGYQLVDPNQANFAYRLTDSDNQVVTIHLKHQLGTEDVVVPKDYVVHYKADPKFGDKTLAPDARMQVLYHQKVVTDLVTGEKTYGDLVFDGDKTVKAYPKGALFSQPRSQDFNVISGDWHCSDGVWNSTYVTAPEIDNWDLDDNLNRITGAGVTDHRRIGYTNPLHPNLPWFNNGIPGEVYATPERTVYFKPQQVRVTVNYVDVTGKVIASRDSSVAYEQPVKLSIPDMPANWQLMSGQNTDADYIPEWLTQEVNFVIDHKMQYLPNYEHADAVRRITLNEPGGLTKTLQQRYTFYRDAYKDLVTGDITEGDWNLNEATLPAMIFPRINGYQVKDLAPVVVKPRQMEIVNVDYEPVNDLATVKYVDANGKVVGMQTPSAGEFKLEPPKGYRVRTAESLKLAAGQEYDVLVVADKQIYSVNDVPADIQHEPLTKVVTRTIKIVMPNGKVRTIKQRVKFERNMTVDNAGKIEYGDWRAIGHDHFNHVFIPKRVGYEVDGTVNTVADVKASDADSIVTVRYVKL